MKPFDRETVIESVKKTNRVVSVEEGWPQHGIGKNKKNIPLPSFP